MTLSPLPTAKSASDEVKTSKPFPYPKFQDGIPRTAPNPAAPLAPIVAGHQSVATAPLSSQTAQPRANEAQRMKELEAMLSEAQSRAAVIEQEAYDKAYAAGEKSGLSLGEKRAEQILSSMEKILEQAEQELRKMEEQSIAAVMDISQAIVEHVLGQSDEIIKQSIERLAEQAIEQATVSAGEPLTLFVNANELGMFSRMISLAEGARIIAHDDVQAGSCRIVAAGQDILVDRKESIQKAVDYIRNRIAE